MAVPVRVGSATVVGAEERRGRIALDVEVESRLLLGRVLLEEIEEIRLLIPDPDLEAGLLVLRFKVPLLATTTTAVASLFPFARRLMRALLAVVSLTLTVGCILNRTGLALNSRFLFFSSSSRWRRSSRCSFSFWEMTSPGSEKLGRVGALVDRTGWKGALWQELMRDLGRGLVFEGAAVGWVVGRVGPGDAFVAFMVFVTDDGATFVAANFTVFVLFSAAFFETMFFATS